jgi:hypothetical protein
MNPKTQDPSTHVEVKVEGAVATAVSSDSEVSSVVSPDEVFLAQLGYKQEVRHGK